MAPFRVGHASGTRGSFRAIRTFDAVTLTIKDGKIFYNDRPFAILHPDTLLRDRTYWIMKKNGHLMTNSPVDTFTYVRVTPPDTTPAYLKTLAGTYHSYEANATYRIELKEGTLIVNQIPTGSWKLEPSFYDGFFADGEDMYEFKRDKKGKVVALEVSVSRAERVLFLRQ